MIRPSSARPLALLLRPSALVISLPSRPLLLSIRAPQPPTHAHFSTSPARLKKGGKKSSKSAADTEDDAAPAPATNQDVDFDFDEHFAKLEADCSKTIQRLKDDLVKLRAGRSEPGALEAVTVILDKSEGTSAPLRDVAHVVPRGRALAVTVYELANVKNVTAAIQRANLNVQPIADTKNPQLINVPLPPPTKESRAHLADLAAKAGEKTLNALRMARQDSHKKIRSLKKMRPDDLRKADKQLEKAMQKINADAKKVIDDAKKNIMEN